MKDSLFTKGAYFPKGAYFDDDSMICEDSITGITQYDYMMFLFIGMHLSIFY